LQQQQYPEPEIASPGYKNAESELLIAMFTSVDEKLKQQGNQSKHTAEDKEAGHDAAMEEYEGGRGGGSGQPPNTRVPKAKASSAPKRGTSYGPICSEAKRQREAPDNERIKEALYWFRKSAEQDHAPAQYQLALHLTRGIGVEKDLQEAVKWCKKSAEQNHAPAQYHLSNLFAYGLGVEEDLQEAMRWCKKSAEQNHAPAQFSLGVCFANGK